MRLNAARRWQENALVAMWHCLSVADAARREGAAPPQQEPGQGGVGCAIKRFFVCTVQQNAIVATLLADSYSKARRSRDCCNVLNTRAKELPSDCSAIS